MSQCKIFSGSVSEHDLSDLESRINTWLQEHKPRIMFAQQSSVEATLVVTIIYELSGHSSIAMDEEHEAEVPDVFEKTLEDAELDPSAESGGLPEAELPY
jgi:hypothetical protein